MCGGNFLKLFLSWTARGFGMRVVGGKTGADGRLFAYIVWTVPAGPAEKGGLQQGDKVGRIDLTAINLEWKWCILSGSRRYWSGTACR